MVLLLVVGLAAVIIVILIAVFLSVRLGRSEDHDEPMGRSSDRGRDRPDAGDPGWRDESAPRRSPAGASSRGGPWPQTQDRRYRDGDGRRPERGQAPRPGDYDSPQRAGRYDSGPLEQPADARQPVTASSRRPGSGRDHGARRAGNGHGRPESTAALYDTGPARRPAADDFPSEPLRAADFPSGEFPSQPQPADFPSGEFPPASRSAADAPTARYRTAAPHTDEFASGPLPETEFASSEFPAADFPSAEMPAARTRPAPPKTDPGRDRSDSRRRPGKGQNAPKGRSRKRDDDDDWPSMEWDKLTDEQYWAQLSSDKPLAPTARSARPASEPRPPAGEPTRSAASKNGHARSAAQPTAPHARSRDLPGRKPASPEREAAPAPEAAPRREDTASRRTLAREAAPWREETASRQAPAREPAPRREDTAPRRATERETVSRRETEREAAPRRAAAQREAVTERLPVRPRPQPAATAAPRNGTPAPLRPDATPTPPAGQPSLAMLTSLASGPAGTLDDDPLTSPSFSRPTGDSRSYRRSNGQVGAGGAAARPDEPPAAAGYGSGAHAMAGYGGNGHSSNGHSSNGYSSNGYPSDGYPSNGHTNGDAPANGGPPGRAQVNEAYQVPGYADPGYAYAPGTHAASPAATQAVAAAQPVAAARPAGATQPAGWHSVPTHTPAQGNPYGSYVEPAPAAGYPSIPPAGYQDRQADAGYPVYPGGHRGYAEPAYDPARAVRYPQPSGNGAAGPPGPPGPPAHPAGAGGFAQPSGYPEADYADDGGYGNGYPGQAPYADSHGHGNAPAGYVPSYPADGYPADQYGQDGYGGYPDGQG
jgi:hypothetical protein